MVSFYLASSMTVLSTALVYGQVNLQETSLSNLSEDRYWCKGRSTLRGQLRYASWRTVTGERADQLSVMLLSGHILVLGQVNGQETSLCDLLEDRYLCKGRSTLKGGTFKILFVYIKDTIKPVRGQVPGRLPCKLTDKMDHTDTVECIFFLHLIQIFCLLFRSTEGGFSRYPTDDPTILSDL